MSEHILNAETRNTMGRKNRDARAEGKIPAVMYGFEVEPSNITLDRNELERMYTKAGESTVVALTIDGQEHNVLIQDLQRDPLTDFITHADFRRINMNEKVETSVRITLTGISPAVKDLGGTLVQSLEEVEVEALPIALVREFILDISTLATFDDALHVSDIPVPEGMEILTEATQTIAIVQEPRSEDELAALDVAIPDGADGKEPPEAAAAEGADAKKEGSNEA